MKSRSQGELGRREFLCGLGSAGALGATGWLDRTDGRPSTVDARGARVSRLKRIGIELYTVRQELAKDVEGTLARLRNIGFQEVEFASYPPGTAHSLRAILDRHGLRAPSSHVGLQSLRTDWDRTLEQAAVLEQRYIVVASVPGGERKSADDWKRIAAALNKAGEQARKRDIQLGYHNHDFEFSLLDGIVPYDLLLAETDPKLVVLEMDLYWITRGGKDPLDYFAKWPGRFPLVHVKDMDATPRQYFTDVGKGTIDFRRIFRRAKQGGILHYFYEQDETPGSPFESAKASYDYLRALSF